MDETEEARSREREVEALSSRVSMQIRCCEQTLHQIRAAGGANSGLLDGEFRQNVQRNLASQLQQLSKQCREAQRAYLAELRRRHAVAEPARASQGAQGEGGTPPAAPVQMQKQLQELDDMELVAAQRSSEIAQIASSVVELNRIFKDLAALVIDQGTILDRIDCNAEKIFQRSDEAKGQLQKAVVRKKESDSRAWYCLLVWGAADAVLLLVLLIKYQLKYGLKNVLIFVLVAGALITAFYCWLRHCRPKALEEGPAYLDRVIPEGYRPNDLWKKIRPGPINTAQMGVSAMRAGP